MRKRFFEGVWLYCSLADEVVLLTFNAEQITRKGNVIHSASCSRYAECSCLHYGLADECMSLFQQAEKTIRNDWAL